MDRQVGKMNLEMDTLRHELSNVESRYKAEAEDEVRARYVTWARSETEAEAEAERHHTRSINQIKQRPCVNIMMLSTILLMTWTRR